MRAAKRDTQERVIVNALRDAGYLVWQLDHPADLLLQRDGRTWLLEVKTGKGRLTSRQKRVREMGWVIPVVRTVSEALEAVA